MKICIIYKMRNCNNQINFTSYIKCKYYFAPFWEYSQRDAPRMQLVPWIDTRKKHRGLDQLRGRGLDEQWWVSQLETVACSDHHAMSMMSAHATLVYLVLRPEVQKRYCLPDGDSDPTSKLWKYYNCVEIQIRSVNDSVYITHLLRISSSW